MVIFLAYITDFLSYANSTKIVISFSRQTFCQSVSIKTLSVSLLLAFVSLADGFVTLSLFVTAVALYCDFLP